MKYPYLTGKHDRRCKAVGIIMTPGRSDLETYCECGNHSVCRIYRNRRSMKPAMPGPPPAYYIARR